jgi:hypothetical protein
LSPKAKLRPLPLGPSRSALLARPEAGVGDDQRVVFGLAIVEDGRDHLGAGFVVGQHIAPRPDQRDVGFAVGQRLCEPFPAIDGAQLDRAVEAGREVVGERAVSGVVLVPVGLEEADAELERRAAGESSR